LLKRPAALAPALVAAALAVFAAPAGAHAAALALSPACTYTGEDVNVRGSGFSPNVSVALSGDAAGTAVTDAAGSFVAKVRSPVSSSLTGSRATLQAAEVGGNPANTASAHLKVVKDLFASNAPITGRPDAITRWRFAGFGPGRPIYGHYRFHGRTLRSYRFGLAKGACGTLSVRARRMPVRSRVGTWTLQLDQHPAFHSTTQPRRTFTFSISRR
jgi:hypothetical protein